MATGTSKSTERARSGSGPKMHYDRVIDQQLARTRRRVKMVELGVSLMGLVGIVTLYALLVVLIDHWVFGLSAAGRFLALGALLLGVGFYCARFVFPLLARRINPGYAARAIEQHNPSLKNSVINFLMFRRVTTPTGRLVYRALQQRAALDLKQVNVDLAVDRSRLIHVGYIVVTLMVLFAGYIILSPKDTFQTVQRVCLPWMDIGRPTRVTIDDVQPGDSDVFLNDLQRVSARITGVGSKDTVRLLYTTEDEQIVDRAIMMDPSESGQRYTCTVPEDARGIQQSLRYRIVAGDAESPEFQLMMKQTPRIVVSKIDYDFPEYTRLQPRTSEGEPEIRALEGTVVTVHARSNHDIADAEIEFDPDGDSAVKFLTMRPDGKEATCSFTLVWDDNRNAPKYSSYRITFEPKLANNKSRHVQKELPAEHDIVVIPDLPPEISVRKPEQRELDVPVNGSESFEVSAIDPDFGLTRITLRAKTADRDILQKEFPQPPPGRKGWVTVEYDFRPAELQLQAGDTVELWAEAEDNCTQPNPPGKTRRYTLNIVAADDAGSDKGTTGQSNPETGAAQDQDAGQQPQQQPTEAQSGTSSESEQGSSNDDQTQQGDAGEEQPGETQSGAGTQGETGQSSASDGQQGDSGDASSSEPQPAEQGQQSEGSQTGEGGSQENGEEGNDSGSQSSESGSGGSQGSSGGSPGNSSGKATGQQSTSEDGSNSGGDPANAEPSQDSQSRPYGGSDQADSGQSGSREEPLHEGEAMERILDHIKQTQGDAPQDSATAEPQPRENSPSPADPNSNPGDSTAEGASQDGTGDESQHDGASGSQKSDQSSGASESEAQPGARDAQPDSRRQDEASQDDTSDHPGKKSLSRGAADNADPQQGPGERPELAEDPKGAEETESSDNENTGPSQKNSGVGDEGSPGSGSPAENEDGATGSKRENQDRNKNPGQDNREPSDDEVTTPSMSRKQSDSQGGEDGDESGGGEQGGGQSANQPGRDSPGSNMSSDQGNTGSPESGQGETADRGGDQQQSPDKSGQSGQDPGQGSQTQSSSEGQQQQADGAMPQPPPDAIDPNKIESPEQRGEQDPSNRTSGGLSSGNPDGGGIASNSPSVPNRQPREVAAADAANLEYARQATDMVLEHLQDQQFEPDSELLDSLGWTKDELEQFVQRWQAMKRSAREQGGKAQDELDDALRSLGLRPAGPDRRVSQSDKDQYRGMQDGGNRSQPPAEILEQFNAYRKGAARGPRSGG